MPRSLSRLYFALPASCWQLAAETRLPGRRRGRPSRRGSFRAAAGAGPTRPRPAGASRRPAAALRAAWACRRGRRWPPSRAARLPSPARGRLGARGVGGGHDHDDHGAGHVAGGHVRAAGGAVDVDALRAVGVAALPLVRVGQRARARPGARVGRQRPADVIVAGDRRGDRVGRRRGQDRAGRAGGGVVAGVVRRGDHDHDGVATIAVTERVACRRWRRRRPRSAPSASQRCHW